MTSTPTYRTNADGTAVCPHRDLSVCPDCYTADPALIEVAGAHFHVTDLHERLVLAVICDGDPRLPVVRRDSDAPHQMECPAGPSVCGVDYGADTPADLLAMIEAHLEDVHGLERVTA